MSPSDLHTARAAIKRSEAVRAQLRGTDVPDRDAQLHACLSDLSDAIKPLSAQLRSGPHLGRAARHPEAREVSAAIQTERARLRGMLRRASGGARSPGKPYLRGSMRSSVGYTVRATNEIETELRYALPQYRPGSREYRDEAQDLLDRIDTLSRRLVAHRAKARYWAEERGAWGKLTNRDRTLAATAVETQRRLTKLRQRAKRAVAVPIDIGFSEPRPKATPAKRPRWTGNEAWAALVEYTRLNGRPPRASDFPNNPSLPSYATIHTLLGGLSDIGADLLRDARNS